MLEGYVTVGVKEWVQLKEDSDFLSCLEAAGVDNWEGYSVAVQLSDGELDEEDL